MLGTNYNAAFNLMCSTDEELAELIQRFVESIPSTTLNRIKKLDKEGMQSKGNNTWTYYNDGEGLSISVGSKTNSSKDYMSLYLKNLKKNQILDLGKQKGEELVGYVTFHLNSNAKQGTNIQLTYNVYLKRHKDNYYLDITTNSNNNLSDRMHLITINGLKSMVERLANGTGRYLVSDIDSCFKTANNIKK